STSARRTMKCSRRGLPSSALPSKNTSVHASDFHPENEPPWPAEVTNGDAPTSPSSDGRQRSLPRSAPRLIRPASPSPPLGGQPCLATPGPVPSESPPQTTKCCGKFSGILAVSGTTLTRLPAP